jgi:hypothetical protein
MYEMLARLYECVMTGVSIILVVTWEGSFHQAILCTECLLNMVSLEKPMVEQFFSTLLGYRLNQW